MRRSIRLVLLAALMVMAMALGASAASAGEVTGNGDITGAPSNANSICAFSGQNDGNDPPGRVQSFGQDVKNGLSPQDFNPGDICQGGSNHWPDNHG